MLLYIYIYITNNKYFSRYGYAHLILKLEWAQPSKRDAGKEGGLAGNSYVSGYGKALPQGLGDKR